MLGKGALLASTHVIDPAIDVGAGNLELINESEFTPLQWEKGIKSTEPLRGPLWLQAEFAAPAGFDGAVRFVFENAAGKGSLWLNGHNLGRYWKLGPQQSVWIPLSRLQPKNRLVLFEECELAPEKLRIEFKPFGLQAKCEIKF